ncbi:54S ribosomal protein L23, mitochondrial [Xylographa vitiligo]|nr:54S ribosomal protein L23, mitochondrial [Xylographa vitiligo]
MGKHKPIWDPSTDCGDYVVATSCADLLVTGRKMQQKQYRTHSTRPGSLKALSMEGMLRKWGGGEVLRRAVRGMLPKNRLRDKRLERLKVFEGAAHPYEDNLVKVDGRMMVVDGLEVGVEMEKARAETEKARAL